MGAFDSLKQAEDKQKAQTSNPTSNQDTKIPRYQDTTTPVNTGAKHEHDARTIRNTVRNVGRETASLRLTTDEKDALGDAVYGVRKTMRINTTETELIRISLNYCLRDYEENGDASIIAAVLRELNS